MQFLARLVILISILYSVSNAQLISDYGLKIGIVSSNFKMDFYKNNKNFNSAFDKSRLGPTMGLFVRYFEKSNFDVETELSYVQKGGTDKFEIITTNDPEGTGEYLIFDIQFDYLQLKTSLRPNYLLNNFEIYGLFGASLDYLLAVKNGILPKNDYSDFIWGYVLGFGLTFNNLLDNKISLEVVYNSDFNEIYKSESVKYTNNLYLIRAVFSIRNDN
jgi:hypothetical protein